VSGASLHVTSGPGAGTSIPLESEPFVIGRATADPRGLGPDGSLGGDPLLSRRHAQVWLVSGQAMIEDLGSSNGTLVNGHPIKGPTPLSPSDTIRIGASDLTVVAAPVPVVTAVRPVATPDRTVVRATVPASDGPGARSPGPAAATPAGPLAATPTAEPAATPTGDGAPTATPPTPPAPPTRPPRQPRVLGRLTRLSMGHSRAVLIGVVILVIVSGVFGVSVAGKMNADHPFSSSSSQTVRVQNTIADATGQLPGPQVLALITPPGGIHAPGAQALVTQVAAELRQDPVVTRVLTYYNTHDPNLVARDGSSTYVAAFFKNVDSAAQNKAASRLLSNVQKPPEVLLGGPAIINQQLGGLVGKGIGMAEGIAAPIVFILALFVFRGVVAALMPIFVGGVAVLSTFLVLRIVNSFLPLSNFALSMVIGLGLGLAIDYSLFVVSRYREEMTKIGTERADAKDALRHAIFKAGRTISYSACTVALALATLCLIPMPFMYSMGLGGAATAVVAVLVALIALPAMLTVLGPRINALSPKSWQRSVERTSRPDNKGSWYRLAQAVMRRPALYAVAAAVLLIALALPALGIKFIGVDSSGVPTGQSSRTVADTIAARYPGDPSSDITALVHAPQSSPAQIALLASRLGRLPGAVPQDTTTVQALPGGYYTFSITPSSAALSTSTINLVKQIRAQQSPPVEVTGTTATFLDQKSTIDSRLALVAILLCLMTVIVLFMMTGSIVIPLKSLVMTFLSIAASFGVLVLIFQDAHLQGILDYTSLHAIDLSQPVLIFAIAFGLSCDYGVFLLARIKEAYDAGAPNREAVATGLERSGRIVTQAAILFCVAIGAFATSSIVFIKEVGVGIAVAVILDATVVRAFLVPSLMALLGKRNWWAPAPLKRLYGRIGLSED
jgi:uncharacterized membrane protein YdfJ with MMPL/SSD domain